MAVLTSSQVVVLHSDGAQQKLVVYTVTGVTTNDTWLAATQFAKDIQATWYPAGGSSTGGTCTISTNTTVTFSPASISADSGYLVCLGESA